MALEGPDLVHGGFLGRVREGGYYRSWTMRRGNTLRERGKKRLECGLISILPRGRGPGR